MIVCKNVIFLLFMLTASTNVIFTRAAAIGYETSYWKERYFVIYIQQLITLLKITFWNKI